MSSELYMAEAHKGREVIYACLSRIFLEPPSDNIYKMLETILPDISCMGEDCENSLIKEGLEGLGKFVENRGRLSGSGLAAFDEATSRHFTRVYCLTDSVPVSESVYTSVEHLSMQDEAGQVQAIYDACGFDMKNPSNEPPDHVSYELMFMSYLAKGTRKHLEKGGKEHAEVLIDLQKNFISGHMLKWLDGFVKATLKFSESLSLYAPAAYFMLGYVKEDEAFLEG